jgi:hypothetical protein
MSRISKTEKAKRLLQATPTLTALALSEKMGISRNYAYKLMHNLKNEVKVEDVIEEKVTQEDEDDAKGLKTECLNQVKDTSNKFLSRTDWMLVRKIERDVAIPTATVTYRAAVLTEYNRLKTAIISASTIEEFIAVVASQNWPALT